MIVYCLNLGIFHCFAHKYECQILFSPRMIEGMGWTDGEDNERFWSSSRHVVASLRVSGSYTRFQTLTHLALQTGENCVRKFPITLRRQFRQTLRRLKKAEKEVEEYCSANDSNIEELLKEANSMRKHYLDPSPPEVDIEDEICELLDAIEDLELLQAAQEQVKMVCGKERMDFKLNITLKTERRIPKGVDNTLRSLHEKLDSMLLRADLSMEDWVKDGVKTLRYKERQRGQVLLSLWRLKNDIWKALVALKCELHRLHSSSLGQGSYTTFLINRD